MPRSRKAQNVPQRDADRTQIDLPPANQRDLTAVELAQRDPDAVADYLANHLTPTSRPGLQAFCDELLAKVDKGHPKALNLYAKIMKLAGAQVQIVNQFIRQVGGTPERARTGVTLLDRVEGLTEDDVVSIVQPFLEEYYRRRGKRLVVAKEAARDVEA